jgi:hypothetical protein
LPLDDLVFEKFLSRLLRRKRYQPPAFNSFAFRRRFSPPLL